MSDQVFETQEEEQRRITEIVIHKNTSQEALTPEELEQALKYFTHDELQCMTYFVRPILDCHESYFNKKNNPCFNQSVIATDSVLVHEDNIE
jgi:hypothetical protein